MTKTVNNILECITIELNIEKRKNIAVSCMYRTPGPNIDTFLENFSVIHNVVDKNKIFYVCGDFNIDLLKHETNRNTKDFLDTLFSLGLYPMIVKPSRITTHSNTLIDNIFTNNLSDSSHSGLLINDITDHSQISHFSTIIKKNIIVISEL